MFKAFCVLTGAVMLAALGLAIQQAQAQRNEDAPKAPGTCAVYHTHTHGDGSRSYQLTCSAPVPDSIMVRLPKG